MILIFGSLAPVTSTGGSKSLYFVIHALFWSLSICYHPETQESYRSRILLLVFLWFSFFLKQQKWVSGTGGYCSL